MNLLDLAISISCEDKASGKISSLSSAGIATMTALGNVIANVFTTAMDVVADSVGDAISRVDTLNAYPKVMESLGYSADDAAASMEALTEGIDGLPTTLNSIVTVTQSLAPMCDNLDQASDLAIALNDAMLAGGQGTDVANAAITQFTQMLAVGKVDMQAWNSVVTAAPGQMDQLAKSMLGATANSTDLYSAIQDGTLSMDDLVDAIIDLDQNGGEGFSSFAEQAQASTGGIQTSFSIMSTAVTNNVSKVLDVLADTGVFSTMAQSFKSAVGEIGDAAADLTQKAVNLVSDLSSVFSEGGMSGVFEYLRDSVPGIIEGVASSLESRFPGALSTVQSAAQTAMDVITGAIDNFKATIDSVATVVTPILESVITGVQNFAAAFTGAFALEGGAGDALSTIASLLGSISSPLGLVGTLFRTFTDELAGLASTVGANVAPIMTTLGQILGDMAATMLPAISAAISSVSSIIGQLIPTISNIASAVLPTIATVIQNLAPVISQITTFVANLISTIAPLVATLVAQLLPVITNIVTAISSFVTAVAPVVSAVLSTIMAALNALLPVITDLISVIVNIASVVASVIGTVITLVMGVVTAITSAVGTVITIISDVLTTIISVFGGIVSTVTGAISSVVSVITSGFNAALNVVSSVINSIVAFIAGLLSNVQTTFNNVVSVITSAVNNAFTAARNAFNKIVTAVANAMGNVISTVGELPGKILSAFSDAGSWLVNAGKSIINGLLNGLKSAFSSVTSWVSGIADTIASLKGPLPYDRKLLIPAGLAIMEGLRTSLAEGFEAVKGDLVGYTADIGATTFSVPSTAVAPVMAAAGAQGGSTTYNLYLDGSVVAVDARIQSAMEDFVNVVIDKAAM